MATGPISREASQDRAYGGIAESCPGLETTVSVQHAAPGFAAAPKTRPPRRWTRLRTHSWHWSLDTRPASGANAAGSHALRARAAQLVAPAYRARLARNIESIVARAEPPYTLTAAAPVRRRALLEARAEVLGAGGLLRAVVDSRPQGVALAADLLTDTAGPLSNPEADEHIEDAARRASDALERPVPAVARC